MSFGGFGVSIGDAFAIGNFAWNLYRACKSASGDFASLSKEVVSLHTAIRELSDEIRNVDSIHNYTNAHRKAELEEILANCRSVLTELEQLLSRYSSLGSGALNTRDDDGRATFLAASGKKVWNRLRFSSKEISSIRDKLVFYTSTISLFLQTLGSGSLRRIEGKLDELIQEVRSGKRETTTFMIFGEQNEPEDVHWNSLEDAIQDEDITRAELDAHQNGIRAYLQEQVAKFDLPIRLQPVETRTFAKAPAPIDPVSPVDQNFRTTTPSFRWIRDDACGGSRKLHGLPHLVPPPDRVLSSLTKSDNPEKGETDHDFVESSSGFSTGSHTSKIYAILNPLKRRHSYSDLRVKSGRIVSSSQQTGGVIHSHPKHQSTSPYPNPYTWPHSSDPPSPFSGQSGAFEESTTDVQEYDDEGRLRRRTITRQSSNSSMRSNIESSSSFPSQQPSSTGFLAGPMVSPNTSLDSRVSPTLPPLKTIDPIRTPFLAHATPQKASTQFGLREADKEKKNSETIADLESKVRELGGTIAGLENTVRDLSDESEFYRVERDYFRDIIWNSPLQAKVGPRPLSPWQRTRHVSVAEPEHAQASSSTQRWQEREESPSRPGHLSSSRAQLDIAMLNKLHAQD